jgi:hypothetical protein
MSNNGAKYRVPIEKIAHGGDPLCHELLKHWEFYLVNQRNPQRAWPQSARELARAFDKMITMLLKPNMAAWLGLYGPFLPRGIIGAASVLVDDDMGSPFYLPSVECVSSGPGYVETYLGIEWQPGFLDRLFLPLPHTPHGLLPCDCRASIIICPRAILMEAGRHPVFHVDLEGDQVSEGAKWAFENCTHLLLPNLDFDCFYFGSRLEELNLASQVLNSVL